MTEPLSGHIIADVYDTAYAIIHVGFLAKDLDLFRAELCFKGTIEYDLNILAVSALTFNISYTVCLKECYMEKKANEKLNIISTTFVQLEMHLYIVTKVCF